MVAAAGLWRGRYCFTTVQCTALSIPKFSVAFWRTRSNHKSRPASDPKRQQPHVKAPTRPSTRQAVRSRPHRLPRLGKAAVPDARCQVSMPRPLMYNTVRIGDSLSSVGWRLCPGRIQAKQKSQRLKFGSGCSDWRYLVRRSSLRAKTPPRMTSFSPVSARP